jgi:LCP family protein required for cell wall assembly
VKQVTPRTRFWLRVSVAALSFAILIGSGVVWATYRAFVGGVPRGADVPGLASGHDPDGNATNILLVGNDSRAGASPAELRALHDGGGGGGVNTDTMIIMHLPGNGAAPTLVSIPRDSWVRIPGYGHGKINAAYGDAYTTAKDAHRSEKQAESAALVETIKTIQALTGLHIDHYAQVDLLGFYRISNAIGGVRVCLKAAQNAFTDRDAYGSGYSGIDLPRGESVIKGKQALAFVRQRHGLPHGDLDRIRRQQYFLAAALRKVTTAGVLLNPVKLHQLLHAVGRSLLTDPGLNLIDLAREMQSVTQGKIRYVTIPNDGPQMIYPNGVATSVIGIDRVALPGFVRELQGRPDDPELAGAKPSAPSSVQVEVLNATDVAGLAARNAAGLRADGFRVAAVGSTSQHATTQIEYPAGAARAAKAVLARVPGAQTLLTGRVKHVTLVLGTDGHRARGVRAPHHATKHHPTRARAAARRGLGCIN